MDYCLPYPSKLNLLYPDLQTCSVSLRGLVSYVHNANIILV